MATTKTTISKDDARDLLLITAERNGSRGIGTPGSAGIAFVTAHGVLANADRVEMVTWGASCELWLIRSGYGTTVLYVTAAYAGLAAWRQERAEMQAQGAALLERMQQDGDAKDPFGF